MELNGGNVLRCRLHLIKHQWEGPPFHIQKNTGGKVFVSVGVTKRCAYQRGPMKHPPDIHHSHGLSAKLEYPIGGCDTIPTIGEVPEYRVHCVPRPETAGVSKNRPSDQLPSNAPDEESKVGDQRLSSLRLKGKVDAEVTVIVRVKARVGEADGVES